MIKLLKFPRIFSSTRLRGYLRGLSPWLDTLLNANVSWTLQFISSGRKATWQPVSDCFLPW